VTLPVRAQSAAADLSRRIRHAASRRNLFRYARFNHRATWPAQQYYVLAQAPDDPVLIRHLRATKPENIGRAGHLLFRRPAMFLRRSGPLNNNKAADRYREALDNPVCCHARLP
jgi:hypothetical protein